MAFIYVTLESVKERRRSVESSPLFHQALSAQQWVDMLLRYAVERGCSDIHIEPRKEGARIRLRHEGVLVVLGELPAEQVQTITARVKIMANLDIANTRLPQDGRFAWKQADQAIDARVSTMPTIYGEQTVIRLLDGRRMELRLSALGMDERVAAKLRHLINARSGLWLAAGPTGSGKTTTVYAAIQEIVDETIHIATLEDPVEYAIPGISQSQIQTKQGLLFHNGLRALLRQDPDVIVIGEIRDTETAQIAVRAALTGHTVFSTIHTATAVEVPLRLMDMGIPAYLVADALRGITAQRLPRRLCACKERDSEGAYRAVGCPACFYSGYGRRFCLCEIVPVGAAMKEAMRERASVQSLTQAAQVDGAIFLDDVARHALRRGWTDVGEIRRVYTLEGGI